MVKTRRLIAPIDYVKEIPQQCVGTLLSNKIRVIAIHPIIIR
jgi:hypothetical protein